MYFTQINANHLTYRAKLELVNTILKTEGT